MDSHEFRQFARATVDYVADYLDTIRDRDVLPSVDPGYLRRLVPEDAPVQPDTWQSVLSDVERVIMPGVTHWHSPQFHAYFPTANSYPAIVADIISDSLGVIGFSWIASPACTELEMVVMDWLAKMMDLPKHFLNSYPGPGGGVIQGSASESTLVALLAAKERSLRRLRAKRPELDEGDIKARLVSYSSDQSNSSVEKAGMLGSVPMRLLTTDNNCRLRGPTLREAIRRDKEAGFIPCCVVVTLGTTGTCAFDALEELGPICNEEDVWLHVDAAYAGAAFICPEYRHLMAGVEFADSFNVNPHKWMLVNFDCSAMWVKDAGFLVDAFNVDRIYLKHNKQGLIPDYRHWQIPLGRRFRSLKLWFVLRLYGVQGLQDHIRKQVALAQQFEDLVRAYPQFEVVGERSMGLVCFRLKGEDALSKRLLEVLTARKRLYMIPTTVRGVYALRFVVCSRMCEPRDVQFAWEEVRTQGLWVLGGELCSPEAADLRNGNLHSATANGDGNVGNGEIGAATIKGGGNLHVSPNKGEILNGSSKLTSTGVDAMAINGGGSLQNGPVNGDGNLQNGNVIESAVNTGDHQLNIKC